VKSRAVASAVVASARLALAVLPLAVLACLWGAASASAAPGPIREVHAAGEIVPIPASIPHEAGDMVDSRIVPDLRWIAARYPIYITDGYSGPLPGGGWAGCHGCHVAGSDHYNGLAVDIVPVGGGTACDAAWAPITRLAEWAEPQQNQPLPPFRWVGYNGDAGHGCGNHLHLSWEHAPAPRYQPAEWVDVFPVHGPEAAPRRRGRRRRPSPPSSPPPPPSGVAAKPRAGAGGGSRGGVSVSETGGLSPRGD
jgi:hypothetical protein